jgi:RTX calcium-binding nonapeptide repeat (4 copies)
VKNSICTVIGTRFLIFIFGFLILMSSPVVAQVDIFSSSSTMESLSAQSKNQLLSVEDNVIICTSPISPCEGIENDETIIGTVIGETISALGGNDVIQGNGGPDLIYGGDGDDTIQGGEGSDTLFGQNGNDVIFGDSGSSIVFGGGGNLMFGGEGDDKLYGGSDNDVLVGGPGHDLFECNEGSDRVIDYNPDEDTANPNCENLG